MPKLPPWLLLQHRRSVVLHHMPSGHHHPRQVLFHLRVCRHPHRSLQATLLRIAILFPAVDSRASQFLFIHLDVLVNALIRYGKNYACLTCCGYAAVGNGNTNATRCTGNMPYANPGSGSGCISNNPGCTIPATCTMFANGTCREYLFLTIAWQS